MSEFEAFQKIPRLKRDCIISEKLDGTNAQIFIPEEEGGPIVAGSRTRWITPEDDNQGFARWVGEHGEELRALGPGRHFGEWWGSGINRKYGLKEKRFSLFNAGRWRETPPPACCHVVPVLYEGLFSTETVDEVLARLASEGSRAAPGFMQPEGVVVYLPVSRSLYKVTLDGDGHKRQ